MFTMETHLDVINKEVQINSIEINFSDVVITVASDISLETWSTEEYV